MKKIFTYIALLFITITANAQTIYPQTGFVFYNNNNFSINNYSPFGLGYATPLPSRLEGYSQLNDSSCPNVPVIFSTDGINVHRGSDGVVIFSGLLGQSNSTNAATIVPISGNRALIITTKNWSSITNEAYSTIITYSGGCSSGYTFTMPAATKNLQLTSITGVTNIAEKVTVMDIPGTLDKWLLMHEATNTGGGSNKFLVFRINYTTGTINSVADYSVGLPVRKIGGKGQMQAILGQSMFGGTAYIIGAAYFIRPGSIGGATDFLYMNPSTGVVTHRETILHGFRRPYGLEHSRSSDYTYVAFRNINQTMNRYFNYNSGGVAITITPNTFTAPTPLRRFGQLQRTDDDAIYCPFYNSARLFRLPLSSAAASFPSAATNTTGGSNFFFGLPNYWRN
jgi:hypothetical protein